MPEIETLNKFMVGGNGDGLTILMPPVRQISFEEARLLAAWLVACSGGRDSFLPVLDAVERT